MEDEVARKRQIRDEEARRQALLEQGFSEGVINLLESLTQPERDDWFMHMRKMPKTIVVRMNSIHAKMERERNVGPKG